jgi:membrane-associated phospholipid phosphatase
MYHNSFLNFKNITFKSGLKTWLSLTTILILLAFTSVKAQNFDTRLLQKINSPSTKNDKFWLGITHSVTPMALATPISLYAMGYFHYIPKGKENAYATAGSLAINSLLTFGLKYGINRERPFVSNPNIYKKTEAGKYSFPSGHTSLAFATATSLTIAYPKWYVAAPAFMWAGAVGYSRLHLGVHYPSDVLAGAIIGTLSSFISFKMNQKLMK